MLPKLYSDSRDRLMVWARRTPSRRLATDATVDVFEVGLVDSAMTLAAQAFTSLLPVMIAASTLEKLKPLADAAKDDLGSNYPTPKSSTPPLRPRSESSVCSCC